MSILKYILSPFVEFNEQDKQQPSKQPGVPMAEKKNSWSTDNTVPAATTGSVPASSYTPSPPRAARSSALNEYQQHFEQLIEEANNKNPLFQGTDFKEFMDSKIDVEAITDEGTRYKTAFNVLKRTGLTKEKLVTTGQEYINLIDRDLKGFEGAYTHQYKAEVEQKEQLLQQKAEELQALSGKITELNEEMKQLSHQITQSKEALDSNKASFVLAGENKKKEIGTELEKIDQYF